jgi:hypothetical protein
MRIIGSWSLAALLVGAVVPHSLRAADELLPAETPIEQAIDHYLDAALAAEGVSPAPQASEANLVRRLTLDLIGRIPAPVEVREFIADSARSEARCTGRSADGDR